MASGNNIEAMRKARDWSRPDLARAMGTSPQQVERLEKGQRKLSQDWIERAATALGVQPAEIIARDFAVSTLPDMPRTVTASDDDGAIVVRQVDLSYAMGDGTSLEDYPEEVGVKFNPNFLRTITRTDPSRLFVARGDGDSMFPTLINDDMVLIDTGQRVLNMQDRLWACAVHGAGMIKRLRSVGASRVEVRSDNPTVGNREVDTDDLFIVGRVIWVGRRV